MVKYILYNIINLICFTLLAILFNKWWIILFAVLFLMIPSAKFRGKCWRICDGCGRWSESGENVTEAIERAEKCGWLHMAAEDKDFCPECLAKIRQEKKGG
jgi:hypothetical protein